MMNRAIGSSSRPWSRRTTRTAATIADPGAAADGPQPVAAVGDLAVAADRRSARSSGIEGQGDRQPDEDGADEAGARVDERVARRDDRPTRTQTTAAAPKKPRLAVRSRAFHDHRV